MNTQPELPPDFTLSPSPRGASTAEGRVPITAEMRAGLGKTEIDALPSAHRKALLNGLAAHVGLIALLGKEEGERLWQERDRELRRLLTPVVEASDIRGSALIKLPHGFRPDLWEIHGKLLTFVPGVGDPETVPLEFRGEPDDDVIYALIAITPTYDWGDARGWTTGRELRKRPMR